LEVRPYCTEAEIQELSDAGDAPSRRDFNRPVERSKFLRRLSGRIRVRLKAREGDRGAGNTNSVSTALKCQNSGEADPWFPGVPGKPQSRRRWDQDSSRSSLPRVSRALAMVTSTCLHRNRALRTRGSPLSLRGADRNRDPVARVDQEEPGEPL